MEWARKGGVGGRARGGRKTCCVENDVSPALSSHHPCPLPCPALSSPMPSRRPRPMILHEVTDAKAAPMPLHEIGRVGVACSMVGGAGNGRKKLAR